MKTRIIQLVIAAIFILTCSNAEAKIWRVNNAAVYNGTALFGETHGGSAEYPVFAQIQQAINSNLVEAGDTLHIEASSNAYSYFTLNKSLVLIGAGYFINENPQVSATGLATRVENPGGGVTANNCSIIGIHFISTNNTFSIQGGNLVIERCYFAGPLSLPMYLTGNPVSNVIIRRCYLNNAESITSASNQVFLPSDIIISNNIIRGSININPLISITSFANNVLNPIATSGVSYALSCGSFRNNILRNNNVTLNIVCSDITHNISTQAVAAWTDPTNTTATLANLFITSTSTDGAFQLQSAYQNGNFGSDGTQRGAFGGATPYSLSGVGPIPIIYSTLETTGIATPSGLNVTFSTRTAQ